MIINIKGTSGSGKTTCVRNLFQYPHSKVMGTKMLKKGPVDRVIGYEFDLSSEGVSRPVYLVGPYEGGDNTCGGTDAISSQAAIIANVMSQHPRCHVVYEGLLASKAGPSGQTTEAFAKTGEFVVGWMDTPLETCLERVLARRKSKGNDKPFNPQNTTDAWKQTRAACVNIHEAGNLARVVTIPHQDPFAKLLDILKENT